MKALYCSIALLYSLTGFSQNAIKDSLKVQGIIKQAAKGQDVYLAAVADKEQDEFLAGYITTRAQQKKETVTEDSAVDNSPGKRYKKGDKSTIPQIVQIINSHNTDAITDLFNALERDYDDKQPLFLDVPIKEAIFKLMTDEALETDAIQFIGYNAIDGYIPLFENRLLSGTSPDEGRLFFWLGQSGSEKALNYMIAQVSRDGRMHSSWQAGSLKDYIVKGTPAMQKKLLDYAYSYLEKHPITKKDLEERSWSGYDEETGDPKLTFFFLVKELGDKRSLPTINKVIPLLQGLHEEGYTLQTVLQTDALKFYEGAEKKQAVIQLLKTNDDAFFDICYFIDREDATGLKNDAEVSSLVFKTFERLKKTDVTGDVNTYSFVVHFPSESEAKFKALVEKNIASATLKKDLLEQYRISKITNTTVNRYLFANGLTDVPVSDEVIKTYDESEGIALTGIGTVFSALDLNGLYLIFDAESDSYPVPYDELLERFVTASKGKLQGVKCYLQYSDTDPENAQYHLLVSYKGKAWVMKPVSEGDWYDLETFMPLIDILLKESGCKERFVTLEEDGGQYISLMFGEPQKVAQFKKEFGLQTNYPK